MLLPTSSEFVALCRAQVNLLTQGLGASFSAVYLTSDLVEGSQPRLVPIVTYPEAAVRWEADWVLSLVSAATPMPPATPQLPADASSSQPSHLPAAPVAQAPHLTLPGESLQSPELPALVVTQRQMVLPLWHEEAMLGLLVTGRNDRSWSSWEQAQIRQIANTLTLACVLDQRYQWLERDRQQQQVFQAQQHDMMDNLLHQFRNSLMALQTFGKLILKRLLPGDTNREIANSIVREASRLQELSQQLELLSGSNTTPLLAASPTTDTQNKTPEAAIAPLPPSPGLLAGANLVLEPCAVAAILEPLLASATAIAQDRGLTLKSRLPSDLPLVWANPQALREVLNNLIENALKYTSEGGVVLVTAAPTPCQSELEIAITDTGYGIPPADLPHIFERHYRGAQAESDIPGSGLGLAIAQTLVEQMHGEIQVVSPAQINPRSEDEISAPCQPPPGTTFIVRLAIVPPSSPSPP
ncbi:sensor histidine kinase [Pantanalinema rosaneae CENA516]|uniref:sensor histidine kinase n=1 Tax=Pantanalinema rosaneae TaxID=1620701 RepID=UPI003D6F37DF